MNAALEDVAVRINEILPAYSQCYMQTANMHIKHIKSQLRSIKQTPFIVFYFIYAVLSDIYKTVGEKL